MLSEKHWKPEAVVLFLAGVFLCWIIGLIPLVVGQLNGKTPDSTSVKHVAIAILSFQGATILFAHFFLRANGSHWRAGFGFDNSWKRAVTVGASGAVIFFPCAQVIQFLVVKFMSIFNHESSEQVVVQAFHGIHQWYEIALMVGLAVIVAPMGEEILFRGILYPFLKKNGHPKLAFWGVSLLFAGIHFDMEKFSALFILALLLSWLYEYTNNLLTCIVTHSLFNGINLALFYLVESKPNVHP